MGEDALVLEREMDVPIRGLRRKLDLSGGSGGNGPRRWLPLWQTVRSQLGVWQRSRSRGNIRA